jgi:hypothetical protein
MRGGVKSRHLGILGRQDSVNQKRVRTGHPRDFRMGHRPSCKLVFSSLNDCSRLERRGVLGGVKLCYVLQDCDSVLVVRSVGTSVKQAPKNRKDMTWNAGRRAQKGQDLVALVSSV